jgi:phage-related protein
MGDTMRGDALIARSQASAFRSPCGREEGGCVTEQRGWTVKYYEEDDGTKPVEEWLDTLSDPQQAQMLAAISVLQEEGLNAPDVVHIGGKLWEIKEHFGGRISYCAHAEREFVLLHGYRKRGRKAPRSEVETALRRMGEILGSEA